MGERKRWGYCLLFWLTTPPCYPIPEDHCRCRPAWLRLSRARHGVLGAWGRYPDKGLGLMHGLLGAGARILRLRMKVAWPSAWMVGAPAWREVAAIALGKLSAAHGNIRAFGLRLLRYWTHHGPHWHASCYARARKILVLRLCTLKSDAAIALAPHRRCSAEVENIYPLLGCHRQPVVLDRLGQPGLIFVAQARHLIDLPRNGLTHGVHKAAVAV